jgi:hypothetical protein
MCRVIQIDKETIRRYRWDNRNRDRTKLIILRRAEFAQQSAEQVYQKVARNKKRDRKAVLGSEISSLRRVTSALTRENKESSLAQRCA